MRFPVFLFLSTDKGEVYVHFVFSTDMLFLSLKNNRSTWILDGGFKILEKRGLVFFGRDHEVSSILLKSWNFQTIKTFLKVLLLRLF